MRFHTTNELENFMFEESYVGELRFGPESFYLSIDNVKILEKNSCNRDVRTMRTNGLELRIAEPKLEYVTREGYKLYNADGVLQKEVPDTSVDPSEYANLCRELAGGEIYSIKKDEKLYRVTIQGEEQSYVIGVTGSGDTQDWDRFLNLEMM